MPLINLVVILIVVGIGSGDPMEPRPFAHICQGLGRPPGPGD